MSEPTVVVTSALVTPGTDHALAVLRAAGLQVTFRHHTGGWTANEIVENLSGAVGVVASTERYDEAVLSRLPDLRVIARTGVGFDAVDLDAATRHGVAVTTTPGANERSVADFAMTLILALARNLFLADRVVRTGAWTRPQAVELRGKLVGIVGTGTIGKHVARRAHGFECRLAAFDVVQDQEFAARIDLRYMSLEELLAGADFVTLHAPLNSSTRHLIGQRQLRSMQSTAFLINTARGPLVDERALAVALGEGWIAGAGLDVFEEEPLPPESPLRSLENVILAPHCAGISAEANAGMALMACENVVAILNGRQPARCVNPEVLCGIERPD